MLSIVYVCLCSIVYVYLCLHRIVDWCHLSLPLLSSQWNSYSAICGHTGRSSSVRRNQLFLSMWWKISEIKCALLRECMYAFSIDDPKHLDCQTSLQRHFPGSFLSVSLAIRFQSEYKKPIFATFWKVFVCHFAICHCGPSYDQQRSGKIERDTVFASVLFGSQIVLKDQILPKQMSLHWNCSANLKYHFSSRSSSGKINQFVFDHDETPAGSK